MDKATRELLKNWKPRRRRFQWKEMYFSSDDDAGAVDTIMREEPFGPEVKYAWDANGILVTNAPVTELRRLAKRVDVVLPEYIAVPNDDPIIKGLFGE